MVGVSRRLFPLFFNIKYSGLYTDFYSPRTEIPNGMGVVGHVVDPDDNIIGLWSQK